MKRYVPIDVNFFSDDKIIEASPLARLAYIGCLTLAKRLGTDGEFTVNQARREFGDIGDVEALLDELVTVGLLERDGKTARICSWLDWNPSAAELEDRRQSLVERGRNGGLKSGETRRANAKQPASDERSSALPEDEAPASESRSSDRSRQDKTGLDEELTDDEDDTDVASPVVEAIDSLSSSVEDHRFGPVVRLFAERCADRANIRRSRGSYILGTARGFGVERGDELRDLLRSRPTASVEQIVDLLETPAR